MSDLSQNMLDQALAGNHSEVGKLLCLHTQYLRALAHNQLDRRLRQRVSPSDLVQETLLEAHRDFKNFRGRTTAELVGWLRRILIHNLITISEQNLRAEKRDVRREISLDHLQIPSERGLGCQGLPSDVSSPSAYVRGQEQSSQLDQALQGLSADQRQVVVLRHIEGLPFNEIASRMNRTSGACRMIWLRAVDQLRQVLQESPS